MKMSEVVKEGFDPADFDIDPSAPSKGIPSKGQVGVQLKLIADGGTEPVQTIDGEVRVSRMQAKTLLNKKDIGVAQMLGIAKFERDPDAAEKARDMMQTKKGLEKVLAMI
tara:strand:+ start:3396 stop:3725 length:330 start_codon:yes stop_codon:yes gene_type:complete